MLDKLINKLEGGRDKLLAAQFDERGQMGGGGLVAIATAVVVVFAVIFVGYYVLNAVIGQTALNSSDPLYNASVQSQNSVGSNMQLLVLAITVSVLGYVLYVLRGLRG